MECTKLNVLLILVILVDCSTSLRNLKIVAPKRIRSGDSGLLTCSYDLDKNVQLYTIKWYLNDEEFYRFVPKKVPSHKTFPVKNIQVNISASNMHDVTLVNVRKDNSGRYKCEVTEDAPYYTTNIKEVDVLIVEVPVSNPKITVESLQWKTGGKVKANCTSDSSDPAPEMKWILNGEPLNDETKYEIQTQNIVSNNGNNSTHSQLVLDDTTRIFQNGQLQLKCFAEIHPVYKASDSITIIEDGSLISMIAADDSTYNQQSSGCGHVFSLIVWSQESTIQGISFLLGLFIETTSSK